MEPITFRIATLEDAPEIVRLVNAAFRPAPGTGGWTSEENLVSGERINLEMVNSQIKQDSSAFLLALRGTKIVACEHVDGRTPHVYIGTLAVEPLLQGGGIGRALRTYAEEYAEKNLNAKYLRILVLAPKKEVIAFNLRRGFQPTGYMFPYPPTGLGIVIKDNLMMMEMQRRSRYTPRRKLDILFSRQPDWEDNLKSALGNSSHRITFDDFNEDNIRHHDLVVPLTIKAMRYLGERRHLIPDNPIPIPPPDAIALCDDKFLLNQALVAKGFGKFIPRMKGPLAYPYILKKRIDEWGVNSHIIGGTEDELRFANELADESYFRQIFVPGANQYATHILFMNNKIMRSLSVKYTFTTPSPIQGKDRPRGSEIFTSPYLSLFTAMLSSIGFEGLCCIDYKVFDNRPFVLEINPRLGASLCPYFHQFIDEVA